MDIIIERASRFVTNNFGGRVPPHKITLESINVELSSIDSILDKIKFINVILEGNNMTLKQHRLLCTNPECQQDYEHGNIQYFLSQNLSRLGVDFDDAFTKTEKDKTDLKLDQILENLNDLKIGQEIIYEDLTKEINELKDLYFLGKKKWHQLFLGKCIDMVVSGIVSEVVSKRLIEDFSKVWPSLITISS